MKITVPMIPPSPNVTKRKAFTVHKYAALRKEWEKAIYYLIPQTQRKKLLIASALDTKMRVTITICHKKLYDADNAHGSLKPVLDALRNLCLLADDDAAHLELTVKQDTVNHREKPYTLIELQPCE